MPRASSKKGISSLEISNKTYEIVREGDLTWLTAVSRHLSSVLGPKEYPLRLSIVSVGTHSAMVEATTVRSAPNDRYARSFVEIFNPRKMFLQLSPAEACRASRAETVPLAWSVEVVKNHSI
jgi:hypothetical protein